MDQFLFILLMSSSLHASYFQPAVEAFFLVHAPPSSERDRERSSSSSSRANPGVDLVAEAPAARIGSQAQPQAPGQGAAGAAGAASASAAVSTSAEEATSASLALENAPLAPALSPDQQKFLKFAGKFWFFTFL